MALVRHFARHDREQLRDLASAHAGAATPGGSMPSAVLLNQLEHPLGEFVVGPWVTDLATLVGIEHERIVAAAHLRRYSDDGRASDSFRNAGEIVWLLCWPNYLDAGRAVRTRRWRTWRGGACASSTATERSRYRVSTACPTRGHKFSSCTRRRASTPPTARSRSSTADRWTASPRSAIRPSRA